MRTKKIVEIAWWGSHLRRVRGCNESTSLFRPSQMRYLIRRWRVTIGDRCSLLRICICKRVYWNAASSWRGIRQLDAAQVIKRYSLKEVLARECASVANSRPGHIKRRVTVCGKRMVYYASFYDVIQLGDLTRRDNAFVYSRFLEISSLRRRRDISTPVLHPFVLQLNLP